MSDYKLIAVKRKWVPEWLYAIASWPIDFVVHQPFRWLLTKAVCLGALLLICGTILAGTVNPPNVLFLWNYSGPTSNTVFRVYGTTNLSQPSTNWPLVVAWSTWGTNSTGQLTNSIFVTPAAYFFAMTASNGFWAETPQSVAVSTPPPAQTPQSVGLNYIGP